MAYKITDDCIACGACAAECPVDAISGKVKSPFKIDSEKCVRCGQCIENCKFNAIEIISGEVNL